MPRRHTTRLHTGNDARPRTSRYLFKGCAVAVLALAALAPLSLTQAVSTVLDFEGLTDGTVITNQFPGAAFSNAIILSSGVSLNEFEFPPRTGVNVLSDNGGPINITFSTPITSFSAWFTYASAVKVTAFGAANAQVAVANSAFANNEALSGDPGSLPNEKLTVTFAGGINRISLAGLPAGGSFAVDDITVAPPLSPTVITPPPTQSNLTITNSLTLPTVPLGSALNFLLTASGGVQPYSWSGSQLPQGVTVGSDGRISGVPTPAGAFRFLVTVTDRQSISQGIFMTGSVFGVTTSVLPDAPAFTSYSQTLAATGGAAPYTFSATGLPSGLSLSPAGVISGIPTAQQGPYRLLIQARDSNGLVASATLNIAIGPPPALTIPATTVTSGIVGTRLVQTFLATGGTPPYSWSLAGGSLPTGVTLNAAGILAGTPAQAGQFPFVARVTDAAGVSRTVVLTLSISPPGLTVSLASPLPVGFAGSDYPTQLATISGGTPPYAVSLGSGIVPPGLSLASDGTVSGIPVTAGSYTFSVAVTDAAGATGSTSVQATIRAAGSGIALSAGTLNFSLSPGSILPASRNVQVFSTAPATPISYSVKTDPAATWLAATPASGATPGTLAVTLSDQASALAVAATPYQTSITVTCTAPASCAGSTQTLGVNLSVGAFAPQLSIAEKSLYLVSSADTLQPVSQNLTIQNTGGGSLGIASISSGAPWLKVGPAPGFLTARQTAAIQVTAQPAGLPAGFSTGSITVTTSAGTAVITVSLFIAAAPVLTLGPGGTQLSIQAGGSVAAADQSFGVTVNGSGPVRWTASVVPGADWLSLAPQFAPNGPASASSPGLVRYVINPGTVANLGPGTYYGTIRVDSTDAANSPVDFQVSLSVAPATAASSIAVAPEGLVFVGSAAPQSVIVAATGPQPTPWQASATTTDGKSWLSVSPATGTASTQTPGQSGVSVNPAGLAAGTYYGSVNFAGPASLLRTVTVTLIVPAPANSATGACAGTSVVAAPASLLSNFTVQTLRPASLAVQLLDACGAAISTGQASASFSNGDSPVALALVNPATGLYAASWVPRQSATQTQVTFNVAAPGLAAGSVQLNGLVLPGNSPLIAPRSVLHLFNPQTGGLNAPGTIVQIYGQGLASSTATATAVPLAKTLGDSSVSIGGIQAPLFFVSPTQINAQVPFELIAGRQYEVIVTRNGALTVPELLQITDAAPGLASLPGGLLLAQHADGTLVSAAAPAKAGESLIAYAVGLGKTTPAVETGAGAPSGTLANAAIPPSLTINGIASLVRFAGLSPGLVGLYQINFEVPLSTPSGDLPVVLTQGANSSNTGLLTVKN